MWKETVLFWNLTDVPIAETLPTLPNTVRDLEDTQLWQISIAMKVLMFLSQWWDIKKNQKRNRAIEESEIAKENSVLLNSSRATLY